MPNLTRIPSLLAVLSLSAFYSGSHRSRAPSTSKRRVENFTGLEWFGSEDAHWVKVHVDPGNANVFSFEPVIVRANLVNHR